MQIKILSIPNFYSSYYLFGLSSIGDLLYSPSQEFQKYNNRGFIVLEIGGKMAVIDNHDPVGVNQELYEASDLYFATNKLLEVDSYNQKKVKPIFPHYPVNIIPTYLKTFGKGLLSLKGNDLLKEIYVLNSRPAYYNRAFQYEFGNYVFFAGSTWKKEPEANQIRADFIRTCKQHPKVDFEGGFIPRSDGNNFGYDDELIQKKYKPKLFSQLSSRSLVNFNNPAVLGAVSWRLAEYWNMGTFVLSLPFKIDLPISPVHGESIHYVSQISEAEEVLDKLFESPSYHRHIAEGGKKFFQKYCTPDNQASYILDELGKL